MSTWKWLTPKEALLYGLLGFGVCAVVRTWQWALEESPRVVIETEAPTDQQAWKVKGRVMYAHRIETSAPGYYGTPGFTVVGYNREGNVIWSIDGVREIERIR